LSDPTSTGNNQKVNQTWITGTGWQYIIVMDEYNISFTVTKNGPVMLLDKMKNYADTTDEYPVTKTDDKGNPIGDEEDGTTLQYGRFFVTRETISYYGYDPATLTPIEPVHPTVENDDLADANGFAGDIVELP
jgi:hypothetical protein